jgi:Peptide-N-glycosidase F, C terminal/PDZ domain
MNRLILTVLIVLAVSPASILAEGEAPTAHLSRFAEGDGPTLSDGVYHLLDGKLSASQSNAVAFDRGAKGAFETVSLDCQLRVLPGGDGGAFVFLNTAEFGARGPAPFVANWVEPNLLGTFAVGVDVHNPPTEEPFGPWGNCQGLPEREISLHFDGREIVKRVNPAEFRGDFAAVKITVHHVTGGAEVTVRIGPESVYDRFFIPGLRPYESRLAIGAGTRSDATTEFDVRDIGFTSTRPASPRRPPLHVEVFHHVMTNNQKTAFEAEVNLPPANWAFGRIILTLDIHDGGKMWDEWDRNGEVSIIDAEGVKRNIVPFITSYRTPCHWKVDVTHFRPFLSGKTTFELRAGTNFYKGRGYLMSVSLDFYHGTPKLEPYRVVPLWTGIARYKSAENHFSDFFTPQTVLIDEEAKAACIFTTTTGHSQIGEFTPSERTIVVVPDKAAETVEKLRFDNVLWKADCYLNPNRPQFGTWKYPRAGWAPGDVVRPWWIDLTPKILAGKEAEFRYEPKPYDFTESENKPTEKQINEASHNVKSYLILYRSPDRMVPAPTILVTKVVADSNAAKAGMKQGDYLATYDGRRVDSIDDLREGIMAAIEAKKETVTVVIFRGGTRMELTLLPGKMGVNLGLN